MVSDTLQQALLPAGIVDVLPSDAAHEAAVLDRVMGILAGHGYEHVKPPLVEFEESLVSGLGTAVTHQTFRLMDPVSQRMMGLRADMTPQVARMAATRLAGAPRPMRLSYAGQVVRVKGSQMRPERQFTQVGAELIGAAATTADAEIIALAAETLTSVGVEDLSIDLGMPTLVPAVCRDFHDDTALMGRLRDALDRKDTATVRDLAGELGDAVVATLTAMMNATGPAADGLAALEKLDLDGEAAGQREALGRVAAAVAARSPGLTLTVDPVENRGFEYHTGVTFSIFAGKSRGELGRGGRYMAARHDGSEEPATGVSLFMDTVMRVLPPQPTQRRLFLPLDADPADAAALRADGWAVVEGLKAVEDAAAEARRLNCSHLAKAGGIEELTGRNGD